MGVGDRDGVGVGISAVGTESPCATPCPPFSRRACGCVDGRSVVDGMAAHVPSVTHEVESRQLQGRNVVQGAMRNVEGGGQPVPVVKAGWICPTEVEVLATILAVLETSVTQS